MKSDAEIRDDVINELHWDPQVTEPEAIGVAVKDGAVTLTGHVPSYAEKLAAARAAERVYGVKAVANDLKVQLSRAPRDDSDIAKAIAHILEWNVQIPEGKVHARVENGWVTLDGEVDYDYQKREVERMVNHVRGVAGVRNFITVRPPASPKAVEAAIEQAFRREAEVDARHVKVEVTDHTAKLYGHVHSLNEASAARTAVASAPGVATAESHLVISPWRRPTVLQAAADRYTAAGVPSNRLKLTALRARPAAAAQPVRRFLHGLRRPRALVLTAQRAELCGWSVHLIATSAMTRKIIALTRMEDALPVRE
jgi:osmotically-inducible protein OsmY